MQELSSPFERPADRVLQALTTPIPATPLVSVVMTVYNARPRLDAAIQSILGQSWASLELLVVDDCSTFAFPVELIRIL